MNELRKMKKYEVLSKVSHAANVNIGDVVFDCTMFDYGLSSDDTRMLGIEHISVTYNEDGSYPFFTIPVKDLREI